MEVEIGHVAEAVLALLRLDVDDEPWLGKAFPGHLDSEAVADAAAAAVAGDEPLRPDASAFGELRRGGGRLGVLRAGARGVLDDDPVFVLNEIDELATAHDRHVGVAGEQSLHLGFEIRLIEEVAERPAVGTVGAPELGQHRSVLEHPLHRRVEQHVGFDVGRDARGLKDAHAFVVGVDGAGVAVELRLALEREHAQSAPAE